LSGPAKEIEPTQLWLKLSSTERPYKMVDFPRYDDEAKPLGQTAIRILTQEEQMICNAAAEDFCRKHLKDAKREDLGYEMMFKDAVIVEVLYRACRDADDPNGRSTFPSIKHLRETLTTDECSTLFTHYLTIQAELGPIAVSMSDEELESWITRLAEGGSAFPFDTLSWDLQRLVLLHMAFQLRTSPTDNSSPTSLPDETPTNETPEQPADTDAED
jgi:hypothetical protein